MNRSFEEAGSGAADAPPVLVVRCPVRPGADVVLERTSDFVRWIPVMTLTSYTDEVLIYEEAVTDHEFYRFQEQ
jgi:hypothetical protein